MKNQKAQKHPLKNEFERYLRGEMMAQAIDGFESHCSGCPDCLRLLYRAQVEILKDHEAKSIEKLLDKTKKKRQELDRPEPAGDFFGGRGLK